MKATEAVRLANVVQRHGNIELLYKVNGHWFDKNGDLVDVNRLCANDYTPLVPLKTYKVGDEVTFSEALVSGACFRMGQGSTYKYKPGTVDSLKIWNGSLFVECYEKFNALNVQKFTIVPDPSIPPKPTIESLPVGTLFKAEWYTYPRECIRGWDVFYPKGGYTWVPIDEPGWTLTHIKNSAGEWEEV